MSRFAAPFAVPRQLPARPLVGLVVVVVLGLVAASCGRSTTLGPEEAVEVMVLDGIDRGRAVCIVETIGHEIDLAKVSGLEVDLTDDELRLLATTSNQCAPAIALNGPIVIGQGPLTEAQVAAEMANTAEAIEYGIARLVEEGLEYEVGLCLESRLESLDDPHDALDDVTRRSELIVGCRTELVMDAPG